MDAEKFKELVKRYYENRDFVTNEETAKMALVVPFIRCLGYDPNSPREVRLEYAAPFTQGDGKRLPDRMDFAIFATNSETPVIVIETKQLGTDLPSHSQQLARYIAQLADLHFGIITDGCHYLLYGDLESPNQMDANPFFKFSLDDANTDWAKVAKFLFKFSKEAFNAETLRTDAENSRYREAMIDRLIAALRAPAQNEAFMDFLTEGVYKGKRTAKVMARLGEVAREAIEPALLRVMSNDFLDKLKERMERLDAGALDQNAEAAGCETLEDEEAPAERQRQGRVETTEAELELHRNVVHICESEGIAPASIIYRDTVNYFNVSYERPSKWFIRYFGSSRRPNIVTPVPVDEAKQLALGFDVEEAPPVFGSSRVFLDNVAQVWAIKGLILRSLQVARADKASAPRSPMTNAQGSSGSDSQSGDASRDPAGDHS